MLKSCLCDDSDTYVLIKGTITVLEQEIPGGIQTVRNDKRVILKNWATFTECISKINNTKEHNSKDLDADDTYSKTFKSIYQFCRDEPKGCISDSESCSPIMHVPFWGCSQMVGGDKKCFLHKICHTYAKMIKFGEVIF